MDDPNNLKLTSSPNPHHHARIFLYGIAAVLIIIAAVGAGYLLGTKNDTQTPETPRLALSSPNPTVNETLNWKTYVGKFYSFKYPTSYTLKNNPYYKDSVDLEKNTEYLKGDGQYGGDVLKNGTVISFTILP